ncbi:MAG: PQQ-binding-like beta-propeller repeat protein [Planctomycetes bacterium]|nr:PQQ-binding-like beta-propeller repeat protein [Planctomycetota bacterium]
MLTPLWDHLPRGTPTALALARGSGEVAVVDSERDLTFLSAAGEPLWTRPLPAPALDLALADAGDRLAVLCADGTLLVFQTRATFLGKSEPLGKIPERMRGAVLLQRRTTGWSALALSWDGAEIVLGGRADRMLRLAGPGLHPTVVEHTGPVSLVRFLPGDTTAFTLAPTGAARLWVPPAGGATRRTVCSTGLDAESGAGPAAVEVAGDECRWRLDLGAGVCSTAAADNGRLIAVAAQTEGVYVFTCEPGPVARLDAGGAVVQVAVDGAGETVACALYDGRIRAASPTGTIRWELDTRHKGPCVALDRAGARVVVSTAGGYVRAYAIGAGARGAASVPAAREAPAAFLEGAPRPAQAPIRPLWTQAIPAGIGGGGWADVRVAPGGAAVYLAAEVGQIRVLDPAGAETAAFPASQRRTHLWPGGVPGLLFAHSPDRIALHDLATGATAEILARSGIGFLDLVPVPGKRALLVADDIGRILYYDAAGERVWEHSVAGTVGGVQAARGAEGPTVLFGGTRVEALDDAGAVLWSVEGPDGGVERAVALADGAVGASATAVRAYDFAGRQAWQAELPGALVGLHAVPGGVVVTTQQGECLLYGERGRVVARGRLGEGRHLPALDAEGAPGLLTLGPSSLGLAGLDGALRWRLPLPAPALAWDVDATGRFLALFCEGTVAFFCLFGRPPESGRSRFLE